jgi:NDP-sugar pyrophosphorylase family protein
MKAMVFAAGMGTRLQPLTLTKPKALVEVNGIPMLEIILKKIIRNGFNDIIINVYHKSEQILDFLATKNNFGASIAISDESDLLLDTGGGLLKASHFFNDEKPFLVHNIDILSNINLNELYRFHCKNNALATVAIKDRKTSRSFLFNDKLELCGWKHNETGQTKIARENNANLIPIAFSGIHIISPAIFPLITEKGKFSLTDTYLRLAKDYLIQGYRHDQDFWFDMGKIETLEQAAPFVEKVLLPLKSPETGDLGGSTLRIK